MYRPPSKQAQDHPVTRMIQVTGKAITKRVLMPGMFIRTRRDVRSVEIQITLKVSSVQPRSFNANCANERGQGHSRRAESVLQNCVMGRCAICIFMYCYTNLVTSMGTSQASVTRRNKLHSNQGKPMDHMLQVGAVYAYDKSVCSHSEDCSSSDDSFCLQVKIW